MVEADTLIRGEAAGIADLIARRAPGHALETAFYRDPAVYARDLERIFFTHWLWIGHASDVARPGDFVTFEVGEESVIVVRGRDDRVHALANVCRHRGSRVCYAGRGHADWLVCPYHGWTYDLDGSLAKARLMPADFDPATHGLAPVHLRELHGLIFISLAESPPDFELIARDLAAPLAPYGLAEARVAHRALWRIRANWKLAVENYQECYHCAPAHPEFSRSHSIKLPRRRYLRLTSALMARARESGLDHPFADHVGPGEGPQHYYDRYPLFEGYVTGSEDGEPLAPLLGTIPDYDGGAANVQVGPVSFFLAYPDHVVGYRFTPRACQETDCEVVWLVRGDAEAGRDYDPERLSWLWRVTTEADKTIIEKNQEGVNSRFYRPGPYAPMESFCARFVDWYLDTIA